MVPDVFRGIPYYDEIVRYVERLTRELKPCLVVLFGSAAKGTFGLGSDIDILVVSDLLPLNFQERSKRLFFLNDTFAPIEPFGYTSDEFRTMLLKRHPMALSALSEGTVLFKDEHFYGEVLELFERALKTVRKEEFGWVKAG